MCDLKMCDTTRPYALPTNYMHGKLSFPQFPSILFSRLLTATLFQNKKHGQLFVSFQPFAASRFDFYNSLWFPREVPPVGNLSALITTGQQAIAYHFTFVQHIHPQFLTSTPMRISCSGVGAFLCDFTKALSLHICVYLYIFPLWRRCFPLGFHQSPRLVHSPFFFLGFLPRWSLRMVVRPGCMFLLQFG